MVSRSLNYHSYNFGLQLLSFLRLLWICQSFVIVYTLSIKTNVARRGNNVVHDSIRSHSSSLRLSIRSRHFPIRKKWPLYNSCRSCYDRNDHTISNYGWKMKRNTNSIMTKVVCFAKMTNDDDDNDANNNVKNDFQPNPKPTLSPFDIRKENETSKQLFQRLLIFDNINKAFTVLLYSFVILGIGLNVFGYGIIPFPGNGKLFEVGTLEQRKFQLETLRSMKQQEQIQQQKQLLQQQQQQDDEQK